MRPPVSNPTLASFKLQASSRVLIVPERAITLIDINILSYVRILVTINNHSRCQLEHVNIKHN